MSRKGNSRTQTESAGSQVGQDNGGAGQQAARGGNGKEAGRNDGNLVFSSEEIAERAYQIFEREGRTDGRDMEHWLQAERELRMERESRGENENSGAREQRREGGIRGGGAMSPDHAPRSARQHQQGQR